MKVVVIQKPYNVVVEERNMPKIGSRDILVGTKISVLSVGTEMALYKGQRYYHQLPYVPGYLNAGQVVEVGEDVNSFVTGDRVASGAPHQEYSVLQASRFDLVKIPETLSYEEAAFLTNVETAYYAVGRAAVKAGEVVVVLGQGLMGNLIAQCARVYGAKEIIVTDIFKEKLELAKKLGADEVINAQEEDPVERVMEITDVGPEVVIEASGTPEGLNQALKMVKTRGRIVAFAVQKVPACLDLTNFHMKEPTIIGSGWDVTAQALPNKHVELPGRGDYEYFKLLAKRDYQYSMSLMATGEVKTRPLISRVISIEKAKEAYELASKAGEIVTIALDWRN